MAPGDVQRQAAAVRSGQITARELVDDALRQIDAGQPDLNAFVYVDATGALAAADVVDTARAAGEELGPLAGVPFGVKDLEDCTGMPTSPRSRWLCRCSPGHPGRHPRRAIPAAGAIPIGKTAAPEFGAFGYTSSPLHGVTSNPSNTDRTPGASSGGTAAAVSSGRSHSARQATGAARSADLPHRAVSRA